jgi:hypothetical protein
MVLGIRREKILDFTVAFDLLIVIANTFRKRDSFSDLQ